jgi:5'-3' exonuclease
LAADAAEAMSSSAAANEWLAGSCSMERCCRVDRSAFSKAGDVIGSAQESNNAFARSWLVGPAEVRERYGVEPAQVPDFIALRGDASDRIPGAKGVGPQTAAGLLVKYGSLENLVAAGRFAVQADELRLYRSIATMDRKAPLPSLKDQVPTWAKASSLAREWELNRLADRLAGLAEAQARK